MVSTALCNPPLNLQQHDRQIGDNRIFPLILLKLVVLGSPPNEQSIIERHDIALQCLVWHGTRYGRSR